MRRFLCSAALACAALSGSAVVASAQPAPPISLAFDARETARNVLHVHETIAVSGPLTLVFPKWIPGEHGPNGTIIDLVNLRMSAGGKPVSYVRDTLDNFAFHVAVPKGATRLDLDFDHLYSPQGDSTTPNLAIVNWVDGVLYPAGSKAHDLMIAPSITIPSDYDFGTALAIVKTSGATTTFAPTALETLVDSPVITGRYMKKIPLWSGDGRVNEAVLAADSPKDLELKESTIADMKQLVVQTDAAFGARHWRNYHFIIALADPIAHFGLEHHESSDDRLNENSLTDENAIVLSSGSLLSHEFFHSWNGKYRRPAGLATPNYQVPMTDELLWVYEGLTNYYGDLLSFREGFRKTDDYPEFVANLFASYATQPGRAYRSVVDTAIAIPVSRGSSGTYPGLRRGTDYYGEGGLTWMAADAIIRNGTQGQKSLDDFLHVFHGGGTDTAPAVVPYTRDDVIAGLNTVFPYDWKAFFDTHIDAVQPTLDPSGLAKAGWRLVYTEKPNTFIRLRESGRISGFDARYSLGAQFAGNGRVTDVFPGTAADRAGLAPGMRIIAINGQAFSTGGLREAIVAAKGTAKKIELIADDAGFVKLATIDYHDGLKYPHLERIPDTTDYLTASATAKAAVR